MKVPYPAFTRRKNCRHGEMLYNIHDAYVGKSFELYGEFSQGEIDLFEQIVQGNCLILDIGANIGAHTVYFAKKVGPSGVVIAFEPQRMAFQTLCANIVLNHLDNVFAYQQAVSLTPGSILVPQVSPHHDNNFGGISLEKSATETLQPWSNAEQIPVVTIDSLHLPACHFIKVDVEGMEEKVLRGAAQTIRAFKPILYVENDRQEHSAALIEYIDAIDYDMFWHVTPLFNPANFLQNQENIFDDLTSQNMLCLPKGHGCTVELPKVAIPDLREGNKITPWPV